MNAPLSFQAATQYLKAGLCAIPIRLDGSKAPAIKEWTTYKNRLPTPDEVKTLFGHTEMGIAVICGKVSGNLETLDFEKPDVFEQWRDLVNAVQPNLMNKLVITQTPGKYGPPGRHVRYRITGMDVPGNTKLAMAENGKDCLIETRGEGGYALAPGSAAMAHPTKGMYKNVQGTLSKIQTISARERQILVSCAESLNQYIEDTTTTEYKPATPTEETSDRPGDQYNRRNDFSILLKHGWKIVGQDGDKCYWKRPEKDTPGISATSGYCKGKDGTYRFYCFSTNASPFQSEKCYSPFTVYTLLEYAGDFKAAAQSLSKTYGKVTISGNVPEELPIEEDDDVELFPIGLFPEKIQEIIDGVATPLGCPADSVGGLLLAVASIGIGHTRTILVDEGWTELASIYYVLVAYPGEGKTPILRKLAAPMYEWQRTLHEQFKANMEDYRELKEKHEANKEKGVESKPPIKPVFPHVFTTDATTEKLADILNSQPRGIGMLQDELVALVKGMNQYKAGGQGRDRQFYLEAWAGSTLKVDRKKEEIPLLVHNPYITILGGIQPEMLGALRDEMGREDGFVHRFLFTYPCPRVIYPWGTHKQRPQIMEDWKRIFQRLTTLSQHITSDGTLKPWACIKTPEAEQVWKEWHDLHADKLNSQNQAKRSIMFKSIAYAARLSLIMHMLRWACGETENNQQIETEAIRAGCHLANYFNSQYELVYKRLHDRPDDVRAEELLEWISKKGGKVTVRDIMQYGPNWLRKSSDIVKKLQDLEDRGFGKYCENRPEAGGKVQRWFEVSNENEQ